MAKLKRYVSGYRPPSLASYPAEVKTITRQDDTYLHWLCAVRDWYTVEDETCQECERGRRLRRRSRRVATCRMCRGSGKRASDRRHDIGLARTYVERQRRQIEMAAQRAIDIARWCLLLRGAKPIVTTYYYGSQYYLEWAPPDRRDGEGAPEGYWRHVPCTRSYLGERKDLLRYQGHTIYIGTKPRGGGWDRKAYPHHFDLLIRPGMAPSEPEVWRLVDALLDGINPSAALTL